jgi:hypothetical protein
MVAVRQTMVYLHDRQVVTVTVPCACANLHRSVPARNSSFEIAASPAQEDLEKLVAALGRAQASRVVTQVAIWIVTDDATRSQLDGRYVRRSALIPFCGTPAASDDDVAEAIRLVSSAGIDIAQRRIYIEGVSLLRALGSDDAALRRDTQQLLGLAEQEVLPHLLAMLQGETPQIRRAAAYALGKRGDQQAVAPLRRALHDPEKAVRQGALAALTNLKAVEALIEALSLPDAELRVPAAHGLSVLGDRHAVEPLIRALQDEEPAVRLAASAALGDLGDARAVSPLAERLEDQDLDVRKAAAKSLGLIGDEGGH